MKHIYKTCLLVEDDPDDQEIFVSTLQKVCSNTGCYVVANGVEAISALERDVIMPDYIFTDIEMPRMNGLDFLQKLKSLDRFQTIPVVVYSSLWSEEQAQKVKMLGALAYYPKSTLTSLSGVLQFYFGEPKRISIL